MDKDLAKSSLENLGEEAVPASDTVIASQVDKEANQSRIMIRLSGCRTAISVAFYVLGSSKQLNAE